MTTNTLSLADLQDIVLPEPVPIWPPAPGIWLIVGLSILLAGLLYVLNRTKRRKNAYRKAAVTALQSTTTTPQVSAVLRRAALTAYPRQDVVRLQGDHWLQWLETTGDMSMPPDVKNALRSVYAQETTASSELKAFAEQWIMNHAGI